MLTRTLRIYTYAKRTMAACRTLVALLCGLAVLQNVASQTPIPARPLGYDYVTAREAKVVLEVFYDHLCSDSKEAWPTLKQVASDMTGKDIAIKIHIFPLPYHHNAYFAQQVGVVVRQQAPTKFVDYIQLMFDQQEKFLTGAVNMTEPQVKQAMAKLVSDSLGIDMQMIMSGFTDTQVVENSRYAWKYAASRGITGTPEYIVNGVQAPDAPGSATEWEEFINKLLSSPSLGKSEL